MLRVRTLCGPGVGDFHTPVWTTRPRQPTSLGRPTFTESSDGTLPPRSTAPVDTKVAVVDRSVGGGTQTSGVAARPTGRNGPRGRRDLSGEGRSPGASPLCRRRTPMNDDAVTQPV